jgi:hypothetical protein
MLDAEICNLEMFRIIAIKKKTSIGTYFEQIYNIL